jgi:hypothetical protein
MPNNYAVIDKNGKAHMMVEIPRKNWMLQTSLQVLLSTQLLQLMGHRKEFS